METSVKFRPVIHVYTLCYNEQLILPFFLSHYLSFCDHVTIFDNYSDDNSRKIAESFGSRVSIRQFDSDNTFNDQLHLEIKNECWKEARGAADYVIVCDMDEFLYTKDWGKLFNQMLSNNYTIATPRGFDMVAEARPQNGKQIYEQITQGVRATYLDKTVLFRPEAIDDINYGAGAHACNPQGNVVWRPDDGGLKLLHYRYFGLPDLLKKYDCYRGRLSEVNRQHGWGCHYGLSQEKQTILWEELLAGRKEVLE